MCKQKLLQLVVVNEISYETRVKVCFYINIFIHIHFNKMLPYRICFANTLHINTRYPNGLHQSKRQCRHFVAII